METFFQSILSSDHRYNMVDANKQRRVKRESENTHIKILRLTWGQQVILLVQLWSMDKKLSWRENEKYPAYPFIFRLTRTKTTWYFSPTQCDIVQNSRVKVNGKLFRL